MVDMLDRARRSERMSLVRQRDTAPELALRRGLHRLGLRYRLHAGELPGRPDLLLPRYGAAVFVHGCFWHGHGCRAGRRPTSNVDYWLPKIAENKRRDRRKADSLRALGWRVITVWECQLRRLAVRERTVVRVARRIVEGR